MPSRAAGGETWATTCKTPRQSRLWTPSPSQCPRWASSSSTIGAFLTERCNAEAIALVEQFASGSKLLSSDGEGHGVGTSTDCETDALTSFMASVDAEAAPAQCAKATQSNLLMLRTLSQRRPRANAGRLL